MPYFHVPKYLPLSDLAPTLPLGLVPRLRGLPETGGFRFLEAMTEIKLAIEGMSCKAGYQATPM